MRFLNSVPKPSLTVQVIVGLVAGVAVGVLFPAMGIKLKALADIFLHMIKMLIAPLLFATLVVGIAGAGHGNLGRLGFKTILYFELATIPALVIGLLVGNWLQPGNGIALEMGQPAGGEFAAIQANAATQAHSGGFLQTFVHMFPTSVVDAMARGDILQLVVFSVFFALALSAAGEKGKPILRMLESLSEVMFKFVGYVMVFAPYGVFGAIAATVAKNGLVVLVGYAKLVGSLYLALAIFVLTILFTACSVARIPFLKLLKACREPFLLAFSTASSEAAFPKAMDVMERFGCPRGVVSFVLPTGYTFNLDGSTLYLSLATLFVAQMAGVDLTLQQQVLILITLLVTSKGVAAVPRASLVILAGTLTAFGLPLEGVAVILGIDHIMDMGRTSINLLGNCVATAVVSRWEGVFDDAKMNRYMSGEEARLAGTGSHGSRPAIPEPEISPDVPELVELVGPGQNRSSEVGNPA